MASDHEDGLELLRQPVRQAQRGGLPVALEIGPVGRIPSAMAQVLHRVAQESLTNVLRHAEASNVDVTAAITGETLAIEISDDGGGFPADNVFGRGLTGMHERARALSGSLSLLRANERTYVRCRLPIGDAPGASASG